MKTNILKYNLLISLLLWAYHVQAFGSKYDENRTVIEKKYDVNTAALLKIDNQFGNIHVESWDKNQIEVKVEIITRGKSEDRAAKMMQKIDVNISESSEMIVFVTNVGSLNTHGDSETFEINYKIRMNPNNPIQFENKFGDMYLPFRNGTSEILVEYGNLKSDGMDGILEFDLSFGNADFGPLLAAEMDIQYSNLTLTTIKNLDLQQKFSNLEIEKVENLELEAKYGEVKLGEVNAAEVESHYSSFYLKQLNDIMVFEGNYVSGFEIGRLSRNFTLLELAGQYTAYKIGLESGLSADIEAEFSYSEMKSDGVEIEFYYKDFEDNKKEYKGRINGGNPKRKIIVDSSYGNLRLIQ
ncbi:MAG: hypothetical protein ACJA08_001587 [Cyclobacteriaceae bacterium]|jgi:hypothetical protein